MDSSSTSSACHQLDQDRSQADPGATKERQEARSFLRERFIRAVLSMNGKRGDFAMYENTNVTAEYRCCDREFNHIYVKNLQTPVGTVPDGILRSSDIIRIHFCDINPSS